MTSALRAWSKLPSERRLAAIGSIGLFLTLFLPWYQQSVIARTASAKNLLAASDSLTGWGAFSFVEAAVLVVSVGVLALLFYRAEGHAFHLPGGDGWVITFAGAWTCFLVIWRMFDKQGTVNRGQYALTTGIEWGIFITLFVGAFLTYAGTRIRAAHQPEPPLPAEGGAVFDGTWHAPGDAAPAEPRRRRRRPTAEPRRASQAGVTTEPRARRESRSSWRPADSPEWSESGPSERPLGWLSGPRQAETPAPEPPAPPEPRRPADRRPGDTDQLTIPLDGPEQ